MAGELLASLEDIKVHLPEHKADIQDADDDELQVDAQRLIVARLASTLSTTVLNKWVSPATTPGVIRAVAGRLIAAKWYAELYAEDSMDDSVYANSLYAEAMGMLADIIAGNLQVIDPGGDPVDTGFLSGTDFWPNDSNPVFTMGKEFA